jgi:hypothetical protein
VVYEQQGETDRALHWYTKATRLGYFDAMDGVMRILRDVDTFKSWLRAEGESGNPVARAYVRKFREEAGP